MSQGGAEDDGAAVGRRPVAQGAGARRVQRRRLGFLGVETQHRPPRGRLGLHPPPSLAQSPFELNFEKSHLFLLGPVWLTSRTELPRATTQHALGNDVAFHPERPRGKWRVIFLFHSNEEMECFPDCEIRPTKSVERVSHGNGIRGRGGPWEPTGAGPAGRVCACASGVSSRSHVEGSW